MRTYWTVARESSDPRFPMLIEFYCRDADAVWRQLRKIGWTTESFRAEAAQFARIRLTSTGYTVSLYPTLAAARKAHRPALSRPA